MDDQYNLTQGRLYPSVTIVTLVLFLTFIVTGCLSVYIRNCTNAHRRGGQHLLPLYTTGSHKLSHGLQSSEIDTLPTYIYSDVKHLSVGKGSLECAVCLGEFQNHESLRVLPNCDHVFHPSCIDPWLTLKSTCPVCRADLLALDKLNTADFITTAHTSESTQSQSDERSTSLSIDDEPQPRNCECEKRIPTAEFEFPAGVGKDMELARCEDTEKLELAGIAIGGILNWKFKRSNSTGSSTVIGLDEELIYRDRFRLILSEDERRRIMVRSEHIKRGMTSAAALSLLPSDRSGYRSGADEGDWSDRQVSSLSRKCSELITPATMEGRSGRSGEERKDLWLDFDNCKNKS